ncbi:MAG TPA: hypothetical protein VFZ65_20430 [Planctomycetota bacterium]|nr:hypothetical protein [Planctomycetota bacterium]
MNPFYSFLTLIAVTTSPLAAQNDSPTPAAPKPAPVASDEYPASTKLALDVTKDAITYAISNADETFLGAVILSLSPKMTPYAPGLPPTLTDFVLLGACFGKAGSTCVFTQPKKFVPPGVHIWAQGLVLDVNGLKVSSLAAFELDPDGSAG